MGALDLAGQDQLLLVAAGEGSRSQNRILRPHVEAFHHALAGVADEAVSPTATIGLVV
jgi:hypothetical protein